MFRYYSDICIPSGYVLRDLEPDDVISGNFLELLSELSNCEKLTQSQVVDILRLNSLNGSITKVLVEENSQQIIGTGKLYLEPKFSHAGRYVGHIEDLVISSSRRSEGFGKYILQSLINLAKLHDCYKVILGCQEGITTFYEKLGFSPSNIEMRLNII